MRAEITLFVISPRNSPPAVAHLLTKTNASHLFVSPEPSLQELAQSALRSLERDVPPICAMPTYGEIYKPDAEFVPLPPRRKDYDATRVIVHSSGRGIPTFSYRKF